MLSDLYFCHNGTVSTELPLYVSQYCVIHLHTKSCGTPRTLNFCSFRNAVYEILAKISAVELKKDEMCSFIPVFLHFCQSIHTQQKY